MNEHESLSITSITLSATLPIEITVINHNLVGDEIIYITGLLFIDTDTSLAVGTDLNERFYQVTVVTDDTVTLTEWSFSSQIYVRTSHDNIGYTPDPANNDTYAGGGRVTLVQNINIITKDFNPFVAQGSQLKMAYTDFMTDATPNSAVSVDLFLNSSINQEVRGNILVGNTQTETAINQFGRVTNITQDDPGLVTAPDHGLKTNQTITFRDVGGMTQVNDPDFTVTFVSQNSFWFLELGGLDFAFKNNPEQVEKIYSSLNYISNYQSKPLYIFSESDEAELEISRNLNQLVQRIQPACLNKYGCVGNWPVKNCTDNFIIIKEDDISKITQEDNCVFITGPQENLTALADEFLFKILGIEQ